jgi:hypothetical protein
VLALTVSDRHRDAAERGARWLLDHRGRAIGWLASIVYRTMPGKMSVRANPDLRGWSSPLPPSDQLTRLGRWPEAAKECQGLQALGPGPVVSIPSIRVGEVEGTDVTAVILPGTPGMAGILGNTFLSRYSVMLDSARQVLHLRPR